MSYKGIHLPQNSFSQMGANSCIDYSNKINSDDGYPPYIMVLEPERDLFKSDTRWIIIYNHIDIYLTWIDCTHVRIPAPIYIPLWNQT